MRAAVTTAQGAFRLDQQAASGHSRCCPCAGASNHLHSRPSGSTALQAQDQGAHRPVAQHRCSPGVGRDESPDGCRALGRQAEGTMSPGLSGGLAWTAASVAARFDHHHIVGCVDLAHGVETLCRAAGSRRRRSGLPPGRCCRPGAWMATSSARRISAPLWPRLRGCAARPAGALSRSSGRAIPPDVGRGAPDPGSSRPGPAPP